MAGQAPNEGAKKPRPKTDRKMIGWIAIIGMFMLVGYLFLSKGGDLGQGKIDAEHAKQLQEAKAKLYEAKIDNPAASTQQQLAAAKAKHDEDQRAAAQAALAAKRKALSAELASNDDAGIPLPPPEEDDNEQLERLGKAATAVDADDAKTAPHASFVMFAAQQPKQGGGLTDALTLKKQDQSDNANAPASSSDAQDPEIKAALARQEASQKRLDDLQKLMAAKAEQVQSPGGEGNTAWLYQQRNDKVDLVNPTTAQRTTALYWLAPGTIIHGVIQNAIDTSLPGALTARVTEPVYDSRYGRYLVIPAGSVLKGTYNTAVVDGQHRVMLAFDTLITPSGGMVDLGALAGEDNLGRGGVPGDLHTHFFSRAAIAGLLALEAVGMDRLDNRQNIAIPLGGTGTSPQSAGAQVVSTFANQEMQRRFKVEPNITVDPGAVMTLTLEKGVEIPPIANAR